MTRLPPMDPAVADELGRRIVDMSRDVLGDDLHAVTVKGSAIYGDFIPDFSDFDVHLYVAGRVMRGPMAPTVDVAFRFQERFAEIDVPAYRVSQIQVFFLSIDNYPTEWTPPLPSAYRVLFGTIPPVGPELTPEFIRRNARTGLVGCTRWIDTLLTRIVDKPDDLLEDHVRLAGTILKAALYQAAIELGEDPFEVWTWSLSDVLDRVEPELMPSRSATRYYRDAWHWSEVRRDGASLRRMGRNGIDALDALARFGRHVDSDPQRS
jgi:hypothetical protein